MLNPFSVLFLLRQRKNWRPAGWPWRHFHVRRRELAFGFCVFLAGCALAPAAVDLAPPAALPAAGPVRVEGPDGPVDARRRAQVLQRLERQAPGLGRRHLAQVDEVVETPLVLGNDARLLIDGPQTHRAMFAAIAGARRHISLETYILEDGQPGEELARLLKEKRAQGVSVSLLYDSIGSLGTPAAYFQDLADAGVAVCEFNPVNPLKGKGAAGLGVNNRDHRKILIVDGRIAFTGGVNISSVYRSGSFSSRRRAPNPKEGWRDTHVMAEGPVAEQFHRLFQETWAGQGCPPQAENVNLPAPRPAGDKAMRLVAADPLAGQSEFYVTLLLALANARQRIWLTYGYFVPDGRMLDTLEAAARRGVDVRLVLPGFSDFWAPLHAGRSRYGRLLTAGVKIFERRDALLHAKTAVIDGLWSSVGSTNLDWRSFVHNYEADLIVLDKAFAGEMEALFRLDEGASRAVSLADWQNRPLGNRLKEWAARWWEYLL